MQLGAYDFLEKPFDPERMTDLARKATPVAPADARQPRASGPSSRAARRSWSA